MSSQSVRVRRIKGGFLAIDEEIRISGRGVSAETARSDLAAGLELWRRILARRHVGQGNMERPELSSDHA